MTSNLPDVTSRLARKSLGLLTVVLLSAGLVLAMPAPADALPSWKATDLDPAGLTGQSFAYGINDLGDTVGHAVLLGVHGGYRATLWTAPGIMTDLGTLGTGDFSQAFGVNDSRQVVGTSKLTAPFGPTHAFLWDEQKGMVDLGTLGNVDPEHTNSQANAINDHGVVAGTSATGLSTCCPNRIQTRAFLWTEAGGMTDLGTLGGSSSGALDINDAGQVVGWADTAEGVVHAFLWTEADGMTDLGTLGGPTSNAMGINELGQVAGRADKASGGALFLWDPSTGMADIGIPMPPTAQWYTERLLDVNIHGQVPFGAQVWDATHGWQALPSPTTGNVDLAAAINDAGQIAGAAQLAGQKNLGANVYHAALWNPPAPGLPTVSIGSSSLAEGDAGPTRALSFAVTLSEPATTTVTVGWAVLLDATTSADDVVVKAGTVTFKLNRKGVTSIKKIISVKVRPDLLPEGDEQFHVVLSNPTGGYSIGYDTGTGTILDDDSPSGYTVDVADASTWEADAGGSNSVKAIVTLSQPATTTITVVFHAVGGTASALDYRAITKTLTFNPGDFRKSVNVKVYPDAITEPDETVAVSLSSPTGGPAIGRATAVLSILNDD